MTTMRTTVRDAVHHYLRTHRMTTVFGNTGSTEIGFLNRWPEDFQYVLGLSEAAVMAMADGHSQVTRSPVLVNLHSAAGLGNAMGGLVAAYHNRAPLVVLVGQQERALLPFDPFLASLDPTLLPAPYAKQSWQPARASDVPAMLHRAFHTASQPPHGPVVVSVPADDWDADTTHIEARPQIGGYCPAAEELDNLAVALHNSRHPAFVVGSAVDQDNAVLHAVSLAENCEAAVFAAPMSSRCSFPENHPNFAGHLPAAPGPLADALQWYDLILVLGAPAFTYHVNSAPGPELPPLFVVSDDEQVLARAAGIGIRATMASALLTLGDLIIPVGRTAPTRQPRAIPPAPPTSGESMTAAHVLATLAPLLPPDALVVEEIPSHRNDLHAHLPIVVTDTGFLATGGGVLGYALPAAIGACLAAPHRPVVVLVGDGSLMYTAQALWTAVRQHTPITVIVLDNSGYGALRSLAKSAGASSVPGLDISGIGFADLARSMGCDGIRVGAADELTDALATALAVDGPTLVHVPIAPTHDALYNNSTVHNEHGD
jgi:benzoylformate decarboxylase